MLPYNPVSPSRPLDPYEALGVDKSAPLAVIRSAYRKLVLVCHPDRDTSIDEAAKQAASDKFHLVQQSYLILSDERKRELYDDRVKLVELLALMNEERNLRKEEEEAKERKERKLRNGKRRKRRKENKELSLAHIYRIRYETFHRAES